jgi:hypothetical protein
VHVPPEQQQPLDVVAFRLALDVLSEALAKLANDAEVRHVLVLERFDVGAHPLQASFEQVAVLAFIHLRPLEIRFVAKRFVGS